MNTRFSLLCYDSADGTTVQGITIDAPDSMDLDDAVWLEELDGRTRCTVSIADAAAVIEKESPLDLQARDRGFTRYYARGSAPMLPARLSEDALSLLPDKRRPVLCVRITLDDD